jgi:hypothetical protein
MQRATGLAIVAVLTLSAVPAAGQGVMVGWVNASADITLNDQDVDTGSRNGFTAGVVFGRQSGIIGFRTEALYTQKGFSSGSGDAKVNVKPAYIDVPVMLKVDLQIVRAYAGPQVSFRIECKVDGALPSNPIAPGSTSESCSDDVEFFDFGFKGGIGAKVLFLTIDLVGTMGTKNFAKLDKDTLVAKNRTIALVAGISLP